MGKSMAEAGIRVKATIKQRPEGRNKTHLPHRERLDGNGAKISLFTLFVASFVGVARGSRIAGSTKLATKLATKDVMRSCLILAPFRSYPFSMELLYGRDSSVVDGKPRTRTPL